MASFIFEFPLADCPRMDDPLDTTCMVAALGEGLTPDDLENGNDRGELLAELAVRASMAENNPDLREQALRVSLSPNQTATLSRALIELSETEPGNVGPRLFQNGQTYSGHAEQLLDSYSTLKAMGLATDI